MPVLSPRFVKYFYVLTFFMTFWSERNTGRTNQAVICVSLVFARFPKQHTC